MKPKFLKSILSAWLVFLLIIFGFAVAGRTARALAARPVVQTPEQSLLSLIANEVRARSTIVDLGITGTDPCKAERIWLVLPFGFQLIEQVRAEEAAKDSVSKHCGRTPQDIYVSTITDQPPPSVHILEILSLLASGGIISFTKWLDWRSQGRGAAQSNFRARIRRLEDRLAKRPWQWLLFHSVSATDRFLTDVFGEKILHWRTLIRSALLVITINVYLSYLPLLFTLPLAAIGVMFSHVGLALSPFLIAAVNVPLDVLAVIVVRKMLKDMRHPGIGRSRPDLIPNVRMILGILIVSWYFAGLSTVVGAVMSHLALGNPFDVGLWRIIGGVFVAWYPAGILHPFQSNLNMNGINMGYVALGAVVVWTTLVCSLSVLALWRYAPMVAQGELKRVIEAISRDEKKYFIYYGYLATGLIALSLTLVKLGNWFVQ